MLLSLFKKNNPDHPVNLVLLAVGTTIMSTAPSFIAHTALPPSDPRTRLSRSQSTNAMSANANHWIA